MAANSGVRGATIALVTTTAVAAFVFGICTGSWNWAIGVGVFGSLLAQALASTFLSADEADYEQWETEDELKAHRIERKRLSENHYNRAQTIAAWLLATLVGANGAAALAVFSKAPDSERITLSPAVFFAGGVILAIVSGFLSWREAQDRTALYYFESLPRLTEKARRESSRRKRFAQRYRLAARHANRASLVALVVGCGWTLSNFI